MKTKFNVYCGSKCVDGITLESDEPISARLAMKIYKTSTVPHGIFAYCLGGVDMLSEKEKTKLKLKKIGA